MINSVKVKVKIKQCKRSQAERNRVKKPEVMVRGESRSEKTKELYKRLTKKWSS